MFGALQERFDESGHEITRTIAGGGGGATHHLKGIGEGAVGSGDVAGMRNCVGVGGSACAGRVDDVEGAEEGRQIGTSSPRGRRGRFILDSVLDWRWARRVACTGQLRLVCVRYGRVNGGGWVEGGSVP